MKKTTKKDNELIAKFMGMTQGRPNETRWKTDWFDNKYLINGHRNESLHFDIAWDWLMPVVEEIDRIGASVIIGRMFCEIKYIDPLDDTKHFEIRIASGVKMNAINGAIVEFIQWYNKNKS